MAIFTATFSAVAATAAQDVFEIVAPDAGDAAAELLSVLLIRAYTVSGSGGSSVTPANISGHSAAIAAGSTVEANNTTVANTGTPITLLADAWNVQVGWRYLPLPEERIILEKSQRLVCRITAPADSITLNGTLVFEEIGYPAQ
jgi:hypothetical protein